MTHSSNQDESSKTTDVASHTPLGRRELLKGGIALAGALSMGVGLDAIGSTVASTAEPGSPSAPTPMAGRGQGALDAASEAKKIAFDRVGDGEKVLLISGFPQTRLSWNRLTPLLSQKFQAIPADLPSFGDSGILSAPATTENVGRIFHEFVATLGAPLHVVAHDFGAWCAYSWALLFPEDFKTLTLIEAGIPGITLLNDIQLSDYKRKWNFIFMMLPDLPAELTRGKEDIYVGWWYKNKVHKPGAVGGQYSIPNMGELLRPYFQEVKPVVIADSGHFVPEEQPEALAKELMAFL
jgi:pimeloyl-ACP methyl ester carboxylesterase